MAPGVCAYSLQSSFLLFEAFFHPVGFFQLRRKLSYDRSKMTSASITNPIASPTLKQIILTTLASRKQSFQCTFHHKLFLHFRNRSHPSVEQINHTTGKTASRWLCVTITIVVPSLLSSVSNSITSCPFLESRLPVGSSARIIFGPETTARAMATRCC